MRLLRGKARLSEGAFAVTKLNEEQREAVCSRGNVLLRAGAGSGKTKVLVHHVIFLLEAFFEEKKHLNDKLFTKELADYLSGISLITFTKKAAAEMAFRLRALIEEKVSSCGGRWLLVRKEVGRMGIMTIHSFCLGLLRRGYFPEIEADFSVIDEYKAKKKVETIFRMWLDEEMEKRSERGAVDAVVSDTSGVGRALAKIFGDAELRRGWEKPRPGGDEDILGSILELQELSEFLDNPFGDDGASGKLYDYFRRFEEFKLSIPLGVDTIADYENFFKEKIPGGKRPDGMKEYFERLNVLKAFIKDYGEDFRASVSSELSGWEKLFGDIVRYVSRRYEMFPGFGYADIEYYTLKGLENQSNQKRVGGAVRYVIVDEFQDTSEVQFCILKKVVGGDFGRLYCVGDEKQAIYGFRGGGSGVFEKMKEEAGRVLALQNNYRSIPAIVGFNNDLFERILGLEKFLRQQSPGEDRPEDGGIRRYAVGIRDTKGLGRHKGSVVERAESDRIYRIVEEALKDDDNKDICILYRKLSPSLGLIERFIEGGVAFRAQVKIPKGEDPLVVIFGTLVEGALDGGEETGRYCLFIMEKVLEYLFVPVSRQALAKAVDRFYANMPLLGIVHAFRGFLWEVGIRNSNNANNLEAIEKIVLANFENVDAIYSEIKALSDKYSIDFRSGGGSSKVSVMTVHASKGLEFDHVILAGIHVDGGSGGSRPLIGALAGSFQWKRGPGEKKRFKTPTFIFEKLLEKRREKAESKRLLYVACSRAKRRLDWVDISCDGEPYGGGWIGLLRLGGAAAFCEEEINTPSPALRSGRAPLYQRNTLGIATGDGGAMVLVPRLSVTRAAFVVQCPRKFYLKNVCDLDGDAIRGVAQGGAASSLDRGRDIHRELSVIIKKGGVVPEDLDRRFDEVSGASIRWAVGLLEGIEKDYKVFSELPMKFDLFGYRLEGIADLVCLPFLSEKSVRIIDFKTGRKRDSDGSLYRFQLVAYAYAVSRKYNRQGNFTLELFYVDGKEVLDFSMTYGQINDYLREKWKSAAAFDRINEAHCPHCEFGKLCHPTL